MLVLFLGQRRIGADNTDRRIFTREILCGTGDDSVVDAHAFHAGRDLPGIVVIDVAERIDSETGRDDYSVAECQRCRAEAAFCRGYHAAGFADRCACSCADASLRKR